MNLKKTVIGIELGSTRIKAVMLDENHRIIARGIYDWENRFSHGYWTYDMKLVFEGLASSFEGLKKDFEVKYGEKLTETGAVGISGMMHGYLPFDENWNQLAEFRTWRSTVTAKASEKLTEKFGFHVPQRWSISHLYQAFLNGEEHVEKVEHITTLSGYIHFLLTGKNCLGKCEASGMFPVNTETGDYDGKMLEIFDGLTGNVFRHKIYDILPEIVSAGMNAGFLTESGVKLLDRSGELKAGIPFCPPEGDMGTGMVATNSCREHTGNASVGTSSNISVVIDKKIGVYEEIDVLVTPEGLNTALIHVNNGTSDINVWANLFKEMLELKGVQADDGEIFALLFREAMNCDSDASGLVYYNYLSGETMTRVYRGCPMMMRDADSRFTVGNIMRANVFSMLSTIRVGMDLLTKKEKITVDKICGHGGFFKTPHAGTVMLSAATKTPVFVLPEAGEGGAFGIAVLAFYMTEKNAGESLADYLDRMIFTEKPSECEMAGQEDMAGFEEFYERYKKFLPAEKLASELM